jgi:hypothetical protein
MASQPPESAASTSSKRAGGIEDHESAPYIIKNEIGKVSPSAATPRSWLTSYQGSFATVYRGFHRVSMTRLLYGSGSVAFTLATTILITDLLLGTTFVP